MQPRLQLALQTQLSLPMIPFLIDTFARVLLLRHHLEWYQIPDLVTFLATYACFCLSVMLMVNEHGIPTDAEANTTIELVRVNLLSHALLFITLAAGISFFRSFDEAVPQTFLYKNNALTIIVTVAVITTYSFYRIWSTYLSYVKRD